MSSQTPPSSSLPHSMGPGARPVQSGDSPSSLIKELTEIRSSYTVDVNSDALMLSYNFKGQNRRYDIPYNAIPISDGNRWLLYGGQRRTKVVGLFTIDMIRGAENMAGRPLTQAEAEGFVYHTGKRMRYNFLGTMVGFGTGYLMAAWTWKTMKFPFKKTKPLESYDHFPTKRLAILTGPYSRLMWQITRANIYAAISLIISQAIFGSIGDSIMSVGLYRDTRTQEVVKAMKGNFDRFRNNRSLPGQAPPVAQQVQGHDQDPQNPDFYGNESKGMQDYYDKSGDYSGDQTFSDSTTDTGALNDSTMRQKDRQREARAPRYSPAPQRSTAPGQNSDFFFDDASPTAGNDPDMSTPRSYQASGGSVWDRIRKGGTSQRQAAPPPSQQQEPARSGEQSGGWQRQQNASQGDSFSFSNSEEERYLAKEQAQREFDAMLERERKEGGSEAYTSGSYAAESGAETPKQTGGSAWERRRRGGS